MVVERFGRQVVGGLRKATGKLLKIRLKKRGLKELT